MWDCYIITGERRAGKDKEARHEAKTSRPLHLAFSCSRSNFLTRQRNLTVFTALF